ncbi:MAG: glycosyltransferase family 9 protein [Gallionellaceae bacterium]|jgi:heptosyltransferase I
MFNKSSAFSIAVVRFSALGDVSLVIPAVRALQKTFPNASITWITSPLAYSLLQGLEGVNFEIHEKPRNLSDYRAFYKAYSKRNFDVVLEMQANLRINLLYPALHAPLKIGFDRTRAREGQWLFSNQRIPFANAHLADSFLAFAAKLGANISAPDFKLPIAAADQSWAHGQLQNLPRPLIAIHPFASKLERNWIFDRYIDVIQTARNKWHAGIVITGGNSLKEMEYCSQLAAVATDQTLNLCGQTSPTQLAAVLALADVLIAPDTGPVHLARAMNTPVIGLYAVASPVLSGPYGAQQFVINRYPDAVRKYLGKDPARLPWNSRVHHADAMSLIQTEDVLVQLSKIFYNTDHG